ncbi:MAG: hypothetical protein IPJ65_14685 [Archangiaceae bacterium]|nr:hypothetical protein [Archangiaceae bacterium]
MRSHTPTLSVALLLAGAALAQVSGTVVDARTLEPLPFARVSRQASADEVRADDAGRFTLPAAEDAGLTLVGAVPGYFYGSAVVVAPAAGVALTLEPVDAFDGGYTPAPWTSCSYCHPAQVQEWRASPMGQAGFNTWVYDVYDGTGSPGGQGGFVYTRDSVLAPHNRASECGACHQPVKWFTEPFTSMDALDAGTEAVEHGVSCDVCHKAADLDDTKPNFPGLWPSVVRLARPGPGEQVQLGVLGDVTFSETGRMRAAYQPQLRAQLCMLCHQDKNDPDEDGDFEEPNGVVSEPTYLEWLESAYGQPDSGSYRDCVDCHMAPTGAPQACRFPLPVDRPPTDVRSHAFPGTTAEFLEGAVTLTLTLSADAGSVAATVRVTNDRTGHHVPTSVTIRNVVLLVEASLPDGGELPLEQGGRVHPLGGFGDGGSRAGYYGGRPGKLFAKVNHDAQARGPAFFTEAAGITWDNRLPALAADETRYVFAAPAGGAVQVRVRLIYRRSWRALVDAKQWTTDGHGLPLEDLEPPHFGHLMEEVSAGAVVPALPIVLEPPGPLPAARLACGCGAGPAALPFAEALALALARLTRVKAGRRRGAQKCA